MSLMICPKCGANVTDEYKICPQCGLELTKANANTDGVQTDVGSNMPPLLPPIQNQGNSTNIKLIIFCTIALIIFIMSFVAANNISDGGNQIMQIKSVGGQTLEEAYYGKLGNIYSGYAMFIRVCGIFFSSILVNAGLKK